MAERITIKELAEQAKTTVERLLAQMADAGMRKQAEDSVSEEEKSRLLSHLQRSSGRSSTALGLEPRVSIERRHFSQRQISQPREGGWNRGGGKKTVIVEHRKKRVYAHRDSLKGPAATPLPETVAKTVEVPKAPEPEKAPKREKPLVQSAPKGLAEVTKSPPAKAPAPARAPAKPAVELAQLPEPQRSTPVAKKPEPVTVESKAVSPRSEDKRSPASKGRVDDKKNSRRAASPERLQIKKPRRRGRQQGLSRPTRAFESGEARHGFALPSTPVVRDVRVAESSTPGELARQMALKANDVIKALMNMGVMASINQSLDQDTAILVVGELGHKAVAAEEDNIEHEILRAVTTPVGDSVPRSPVVTVMGHVDHGKTSLLDYIRKTRVAAGESGGITQHIGAYLVALEQGTMTFLDTPGHAAFTAMRSRGASLTDIVVLVVAADDGLMPQTEEAIRHAQAAKVPIVVAINKIDKADAQPDRIRQDCSQHGLVPEEWGGDSIFIEISALQGTGVDKLLEAILLQAEMLDLRAREEGPAEGRVIEGSLDKGLGPIANILVQQGCLKRGDTVLVGAEYGRVRALLDGHGAIQQQAGPSTPVAVLGLTGIPDPGEQLLVISDERKARDVALLRRARQRKKRLASSGPVSLENAFSNLGSGDEKELKLLIKGDSHGSSEAIHEGLLKLSDDKAKVKIIAVGVGAITESEVHLAKASEAQLFGFNVRADSAAKRALTEYGMQVHYYSIIYEIMEDVGRLLQGLKPPEMREQIVGTAAVREVFRSKEYGAVAGCLVAEGVVRHHLPVRVLRSGVVIYQGELESLRRFRDDVKEVKNGTECGIAIKNYNDVRAGDSIEVYERIEIPPS